MCCSSPDPIGDFPPVEPPKKAKESTVPDKFTKSITHAGLALGKAAAKQFKKEVKVSLLDRVLGVPPEIRAIILKDVPLNDLKAFNIALAKGSGIDEKVLDQLHKQIDKAILLKEIEEIVNEHPTWKAAVAGWEKDISPENKLWLLRLYELQEIGVKIPVVGKPSEKSLELLNQKEQIEKALMQVKEVKIGRHTTPHLKAPFKFPDVLSMLPNLDRLDIHEIHLKNTPNVSMNKKLKFLDIFEAGLSVPPDVSHNPKLATLMLYGNPFKKPVDISHNVLLETLNLGNNSLKEAPNLQNNPHLKFLHLESNQIEKPPDVRKNEKLEILNMRKNQLTHPPDVSHNELLSEIDLSQNKLKQCPNLKKNERLVNLTLYDNEIDTPPDFTNNPLLERIHLHNNHLTRLPVIPKDNIILYFDISRNRLLASEKKKFEELRKEKTTWANP